MAKEYIERITIRNKISQIKERRKDDGHPLLAEALDAALLVIDRCPAADVVEVVHGRWIHEDCLALFLYKLRCSVCKYTFTTQQGTNYCPNCGARMDGE